MSHLFMSLLECSIISEACEPKRVPQARCKCIVKTDLHISCLEKRLPKGNVSAGTDADGHAEAHLNGGSEEMHASAKLLPRCGRKLLHAKPE